MRELARDHHSLQILSKSMKLKDSQFQMSNRYKDKKPLPIRGEREVEADRE